MHIIIIIITAVTIIMIITAATAAASTAILVIIYIHIIGGGVWHIGILTLFKRTQTFINALQFLLSSLIILLMCTPYRLQSNKNKQTHVEC